MLPHFNNVDSARNMGDPIYKNLFECTIILPVGLKKRFPNYQKVLLENCISATLPEYTEIEPVEQRFKYSTRVFLQAGPKTSSMTDLTFKFNLNQNDALQIDTWKILKSWYDLAWNNEDGTIHIKKDMIGDIILNCHDKDGNVLRRITYHAVQMKKIEGWSGELQWSENGIVEDLTASFVCDYWEDLYY